MFTVPADGLFVLAATSFPDFGFVGGGVGTYQLSLTPARGIRGRVVDADTEMPLPGDVFPFAFIRLLRCEASGCFDVGSQTRRGTAIVLNYLQVMRMQAGAGQALSYVQRAWRDVHAIRAHAANDLDKIAPILGPTELDLPLEDKGFSLMWRLFSFDNQSRAPGNACILETRITPKSAPYEQK